MLVWVYYSAQIFLLGAEFTWVYAFRHGSRRGEQRRRAGAAQQSLPSKGDASAVGAGPVAAPPGDPLDNVALVSSSRKPAQGNTFLRAAAAMAGAGALGWVLGKRFRNVGATSHGRLR